MSNYIITNIRLPEEDYFRLKEEAAKQRKSLSAVIREKVSKKKIIPEEYAKKLLTIKGKWFTQKEHNQIKKEIEERLDKYSL